MEESVTLDITIPDLYRRLAAQADRLSHDPTVAILATDGVTIAKVVHLALLRGLDAMERDPGGTFGTSVSAAGGPRGVAGGSILD